MNKIGIKVKKLWQIKKLLYLLRVLDGEFLDGTERSFNDFQKAFNYLYFEVICIIVIVWGILFFSV